MPWTPAQIPRIYKNPAVTADPIPTDPSPSNRDTPAPPIPPAMPNPVFPPERQPYQMVPNVPSQSPGYVQPVSETPAERGGRLTREQPYGPVPGRFTRLPQYDQLGSIRPLGPGESVLLPNGSSSSEETVTVQAPNGQWLVIPGLWSINGVPTKVEDDQALEFAQRSGLIWPTFDNENWANQYAKHRENIWERTPLGRTDMQPPLWSRRWPPSTNR